MTELSFRKLGRSDLAVAPLIFGGNVFGWTADRDMSFKLLDAFVDAGFNAVDTADMYSNWIPGHVGGESETILGEWIKSRGARDRIIVATKLGMDMGEGRSGLSRAYMMRAVEDSLRRLQTDHIDLYQSHIDDPDTPLEETLEAFQDLITAGKVRVIGASNISAGRLAEALRTSEREGLPRYETLQPPYNLYDRAPFEIDLQPLCEREGLSVISYYSLASGFLSGKYRSLDDIKGTARAHATRKYLNPRGERILKALGDVAAAHDATLAQSALAWLLTRKSVAAPIVSATNLTQLEDIMGAARLKLDATELNALDIASQTE